MAESSYSTHKQALLAIKQLQAKVEALENAKHEPIAIIGMGCRFPGGADTPEAFWQLLQEEEDAITEVPSDRWDINAYYSRDPHASGKMHTRQGGFVPHLYDFDAQFFRIAPREVATLDPQQRLLLEVSWEALENGGVAPDGLVGQQAGVFVGICSIDYWHQLLSGSAAEIDAYVTTGNTHSVAAGRLSHQLGITGPSLAVDTACSSSLAALHLACQSLRNQECNLALVGGVNRIIIPEASINFSKARMLSPDGRCQTFDAAANGFVRSEGGGMSVLKRLSDAEAAGDNIRGVILGSAVNHDGRASGLTAPNGPAQQRVIHQALQASCVDPSQVSYVETHGTGTVLGDRIEAGALGEVFGANRTTRDPLTLGAVKTNIGHLEAAAGIAGVIKVALALHHEKIPPNLHFQTPNPDIDWSKLSLEVPTQPVPWTKGSQPRYAGVSAFGFSGTNAHVILAEAPASQAPPKNSTQRRPVHLLTLSARTAVALKHLAARYEHHLATHPTLELGDICLTANTGRSHFNHRLAILATSTTELQEKLAAFTAGKSSSGVISGRVRGGNPDRVVFLFTGQGSPAVGAGYQLYQTQSTFRQALDRCDDILRPYLEQPLLEVLYPSGAGKPAIDASYPARFALEYAFYKLWQAWGIAPAAVMGETVGEAVAACVAGVFTLEDGLKLVTAWGQVRTSPPDEMPAKRAELAAITRNISYALPNIPLISSVTGAHVSSEVASPDYWCGDISQPISLHELEYDIFLVCSPDTAKSESSPSNLSSGVWLSSYAPDGEDWQQMLSSLAQLYVRGASVNWSEVDQDYAHGKVVLPTYPFQRQHYPLKTT